MTKANTPLVISPLELEKVRNKSQELGAIRQALQSAEIGMRDNLELIGDRYGVDIVSGEYAIKGDGSLVKSEELKSPEDVGEASPTAQMLTEG